jgi:hypothetical protein
VCLPFLDALASGIRFLMTFDDTPYSVYAVECFAVGFNFSSFVRTYKNTNKKE